MTVQSTPSRDRVAKRWIDVGGQVLCFLIPFAYWISVRDEGLNGALSFILIYLVLGAWQLISCIAWLIATKWAAVSGGRKLYLYLLGILVLTAIPTLASDPINAIGLVLIGTGVLAIYYMVLSVLEAVVEGRASKRLAPTEHSSHPDSRALY